MMKSDEAQLAYAVRPHWGRMRTFVSLVLALSFAIQGFLINTHIHIPAATEQHALFHAGVAKGERHALQDGCVLCMEVALFGFYALPGAVAIDPPMQLVPVVRAFGGRFGIASTHHQAWQSRAPPVI